MINTLWKRFKENEKGQGMVEYGLILALVSIVSIGAIGGIGVSVKDTFGKVVINDVDESSYSKSKIDKMIATEDYIPIATASELSNLRKGEIQTFGKGTDWEKTYTSGLDKKYIQVSDIDLSGIVNFEPIGISDNIFKGIYDGGDSKITNLTVNRPTSDYVGLFGRVDGATLMNISLENVDIKGKNFAGGLVGGQRTNSKVINSYATGKVTGGSFVGGLVGFQINSTVTDSYATGDANGIDSVGGLVGLQSGSSVTDSYATGKVNGNSHSIGGLVGRQYTNSSVNNSYASGNVFSTKNNIGGLVGYQYTSASINNSYATGSVAGIADSYAIGGLVGKQESDASVTNSYATGNVAGNGLGDLIGGLVGTQSSTSVTDSYYDTQTTGQIISQGGTGKTTAEMKQRELYSGWSNSVWKIDDGQYPTIK